jgi:hypothetical protein
VSPGNVFDVLELMVESHLDLPGLYSVAIFVDAIVRRPKNPHCPVVMEAYHAQQQDKVDI